MEEILGIPIDNFTAGFRQIGIVFGVKIWLSTHILGIVGRKIVGLDQIISMI